MKNLIVLLIAAIFLFSCKDATTNVNAPETTNADSTAVATADTAADTTAKSTLNLETFSNAPTQVKDCACYFSNDSTELRNSKYVYVDNNEKFAYVSLNGMVTQLEKQSESLKNGNLVKVFSNDQYEATLDVKQVGKQGEKTEYDGRLSLKTKQGTIIINNVYGKCGCN